MTSKRSSALSVHVWGDFACFTRPELKVERVSYPVITPSAARGVLEAIFWRPEFRWRVTQIQVLKPIRYLGIRRNEVNSRMSEISARKWANDGGGYFASEDRTQRNALILRDVSYVIDAEVRLKARATDDVAKYRDQFRRRVERGRCFSQPYLGCREFAGWFEKPSGTWEPIDEDDDLGTMLFDIDHEAQGGAQPRFFEARLEKGILRVPTLDGAR